VKPRIDHIRHGSTALNSEADTERIRAWSDEPLDKEGKEQAAEIAESYSRKPIARIYTSSLSRAKYVAELISEEHPRHPDVIATDKLKPWDVGSTMTRKRVKDVLPQMMDYMLKRPSDTPPGGESFDAYKKRLLPFIASRHKALEGNEGEDGIEIWIGHTRTQRTHDGWHRAGMKGLLVDEDVLKASQHLEPGEALVLRWNGKDWIRGGDGGSPFNEKRQMAAADALRRRA